MEARDPPRVLNLQNCYRVCWFSSINMPRTNESASSVFSKKCALVSIELEEKILLKRRDPTLGDLCHLIRCFLRFTKSLRFYNHKKSKGSLVNGASELWKSRTVPQKLRARSPEEVTPTPNFLSVVFLRLLPTRFALVFLVIRLLCCSRCLPFLAASRKWVAGFHPGIPSSNIEWRAAVGFSLRCPLWGWRRREGLAENSQKMPQGSFRFGKFQSLPRWVGGDWHLLLSYLCFWKVLSCSTIPYQWTSVGNSSSNSPKRPFRFSVHTEGQYSLSSWAKACNDCICRPSLLPLIETDSREREKVSSRRLGLRSAWKRLETMNEVSGRL